MKRWMAIGLIALIVALIAGGGYLQVRSARQATEPVMADLVTSSTVTGTLGDVQ